MYEAERTFFENFKGSLEITYLRIISIENYHKLTNSYIHKISFL